MQCRVRKRRIELLKELHVFSSKNKSIDTLGPGCRNHLWGIVHSKNDRSALDDLHGQCSLAAADIDNAFPRLRIKKIERCSSKLGNEPSNTRIIRGIPLACRGGSGVQRVLTHSRYAPSSIRPSSSERLSSLSLKNQPSPSGSLFTIEGSSATLLLPSMTSPEIGE